MKSSSTLDSLLDIFIQYMTDLDSYLTILPIALILVALTLYFLPTKPPTTRQSLPPDSLPPSMPQTQLQKLRDQLSITKETKFLLFLPLSIGLLLFIKTALFGAHMLMWSLLYLLIGR